MSVNVNITNHKKLFVGLDGKTYDTFAKLKTKDSRDDKFGMAEPPTDAKGGEETQEAN